MERMARRPPRGVVVVSERYLKNNTILTMVHASRTRKPTGGNHFNDKN